MIDGKTTEDWFNLAIQHYKAGHDRRGHHAHRQVKTLDPGGRYDSFLTGWLLLTKNRFAEALVAYERTISLAPDDSFAHTHRGIALMCLGRDQEALASYDEALRLSPTNVVASTQRGTVLVILQRFSDALTAAEKDIARDPSHPSTLTALMNKAAALTHLGRCEDALATAEQITLLAPDRAFGFAAQGDILEHLGHNEEALTAYEQALRRDTQQASIWVHLAGILLRLGYAEDARIGYEQALRLGYEASYCYNGRGEALMALHRSREALENYERALLLRPGCEDIQRNRDGAMEALAQASRKGKKLRGEAGQQQANTMSASHASPFRPPAARGVLSVIKLRQQVQRLSQIGWLLAVAAVIGIWAVLFFHLDIRPALRPLLLPLELVAVPLYPQACRAGWRFHRRTGFHPTVTGSFLRISIPPPTARYVWRPPTPDNYTLKSLRMILFGMGYLLALTSLLAICSEYGLIPSVPDPFTRTLYLGANLLVGLHALAMICLCTALAMGFLVAGIRGGIHAARRHISTSNRR